ncbi:unknown [Neodiprion lecontei nucleopolyhedrovirus]|uniref:Uncharacterized protein n=1 Tax=Neodiprion lecontei nucleopolyhedrovirus (strain Canada) TaxID=654906 RepID=Q6JPF4_NPVNC|nr:unknown [Neodiprion lecontei nucleopolyhedrovirus]AAQ99061.1 unknown [Neodiprion lecontei nucleopolyhedrovirus]
MNHECHLRFDACIDISVTPYTNVTNFLPYSECMNTDVNEFTDFTDNDTKIKHLITNENINLFQKLLNDLHNESIRYATSQTTLIEHYRVHVLLDVIKFMCITTETYGGLELDYINEKFVQVVEYFYKQMSLWCKIYVHIPVLISDQHKNIENVLNYLSNSNIIEIVREMH